MTKMLLPLLWKNSFSRIRDGKESSFSKAGKMQIMTVLPVKNRASFVPAEEA